MEGRKSVGIIGRGILCRSLIKSLVRQGRIEDVIWVPSPWKGETEDDIDLLLRTHGPVGRTNVRTGTYADLTNAAVVVFVWDAVASKQQATVRDELPKMMQQVDAYAPGAVCIAAAEPADAYATLLCERTRRPKHRVMSIGTVADSLHLRHKLGRHYRVHPESVNAVVLGAHVLAGVPIWSQASIGAHPLVRGSLLGSSFDSKEMWGLFDAGQEDAHPLVECGSMPSVDEMDDGILSVVTCGTQQIVSAVLNDERRVLPVGLWVTGTFEIHDVCISLPCVVGRNGIEDHIVPELCDTEIEALQKAATCVANAAEPLRAELSSASPE